MLHRLTSAGALRSTRPLLAYNKSSGYRWSPIPKPPPPHYDRLYGVHSVLNTLRVAAAAAAAAEQQQPTSATTPHEEINEGKGEGKAGRKHAAPPTPFTGKWQHPSPASSSSSQSTGGRSAAAASLHPHRAHLSCLYVRDFSAEEDQQQAKTSPQQRRRRRVIPPRYIAVRCVAALAKSLDVPVRFVPRSELVQLCGERRNQNIVLEASTYRPHPIQRLEDIWAGSDAVAGAANASSETSSSSSHHPQAELVLFLEHVIDPTNIGIILRTAFFFGVDHVLLSRHCAACTAAVSRSSAGFLEHLHVHQLTVSTAEFLRAARQTGRGGMLEVVASAVVGAASSTAAGAVADPAGEADSSSAALDGEVKKKEGAVSPSPRPVRLLLLGNEDAGLPAELLQWCTHTAHVHSPRQRRLRLARGGRDNRSGTDIFTLADVPESVLGDVEEEDAARATAVSHALSAVAKREHNLHRLARLREKEVSLNVNTATAALLTALVAVEDALPPQALLGMVEVRIRTP